MEPSLGLYSTAMAEPATTPQPDSDEALMLAFAAGLGIPFLFIGGIGTEAIGFISKFKGAMKYYNMAVGALLAYLLGYREKKQETFSHKVLAMGCLIGTGLILAWSCLNGILFLLFGK